MSQEPRSYLSHYESLTQDGPVTVSLSRLKQVAILKAYDHGVLNLSADELEHLNGAIAALKQEIWP